VLVPRGAQAVLTLISALTSASPVLQAYVRFVLDLQVLSVNSVSRIVAIIFMPRRRLVHQPAPVAMFQVRALLMVPKFACSVLLLAAPALAPPQLARNVFLATTFSLDRMLALLFVEMGTMHKLQQENANNVWQLA
jgi:hypothetical protein